MKSVSLQLHTVGSDFGWQFMGHTLFLTQNLRCVVSSYTGFKQKYWFSNIMRSCFSWSHFDLSFWAFKFTCTSFSTELIVSTLSPASASLCEVVGSMDVIGSLSKWDGNEPMAALRPARRAGSRPSFGLTLLVFVGSRASQPGAGLSEAGGDRGGAKSAFLCFIFLLLGHRSFSFHFVFAFNDPPPPFSWGTVLVVTRQPCLWVVWG